jgi:hypothetical protein
LDHFIKTARTTIAAAKASAINNLRRLRRIISAKGPSALGQRKKDAHQRLEELERWSARATLLIFFGIVADMATVLYVPHEGAEIIGSLIGNGLIGVGLIIEYVVILRAITAGGEAQREADERVGIAEKQAAEANARAAEANQKAEEARVKALEAETKLKNSMSPRTPKWDEFLKALEGMPSAKVQILYVHECADCSWTASWLSHWLKEARWELVFAFPMPIATPALGSMTTAAASAGGQQWGITVAAMSLENNRPFDALLRALMNSLKSELVAGSRYEALPEGMLRIVVGPRA